MTWIPFVHYLGKKRGFSNHKSSFLSFLPYVLTPNYMFLHFPKVTLAFIFFFCKPFAPPKFYLFIAYLDFPTLLEQITLILLFSSFSILYFCNRDILPTLKRFRVLHRFHLDSTAHFLPWIFIFLEQAALKAYCSFCNCDIITHCFWEQRGQSSELLEYIRS